MRVLTFTTLYPNAVNPGHGVFVENRLRQLIAGSRVHAEVIAPVPYFPFSSDIFGGYSKFAKVPAQESRFGISINHPRYVAIPKVGMTIAPLLLYAGAKQALRRLLEMGRRFDLIDAHYFYPDGVAAVMLGREFNLPVVVTARGSDINLIAGYAGPRRMIRKAASRADGLVTVSNALAARLAAIGVDRSRITVLRNGVDPKLFRPVRPGVDFAASLDGPLVLSVGNLVPLKGHDLVLRTVAQVNGANLWIVGAGPERARLEALARSLGVEDRVTFTGRIEHQRMNEVYSKADVLVLASEREGWPNVLLEAMACGTRVLTTKVADVVEIVKEPAAGSWVEERSVPALVKALSTLLATPVPREATRAYALNFSWDATVRGQVELFEKVVRRHSADSVQPVKPL